MREFKVGMPLEVDGKKVVVTSIVRIKAKTAGTKLARRYLVGIKYEDGRTEAIKLSIDKRKYRVVAG